MCRSTPRRSSGFGAGCRSRCRTWHSYPDRFDSVRCPALLVGHPLPPLLPRRRLVASGGGPAQCRLVVSSCSSRHARATCARGPAGWRPAAHARSSNRPSPVPSFVAQAPAHHYPRAIRGVDYAAPAAPRSRPPAPHRRVRRFRRRLDPRRDRALEQVRTSSPTCATTTCRGGLWCRVAVLRPQRWCRHRHDGAVLHFRASVGDDFVDPLYCSAAVDLGRSTVTAARDPVLTRSSTSAVGPVRGRSEVRLEPLSAPAPHGERPPLDRDPALVVLTLRGL